MSRLCQYNDLLGVPRKGAHSLRVFDFALVDILLTIIAAIIIRYVFNVNILIVAIILVLIGIFLHWLFCIDTKLNRLIGL